MEKEEEYIWKSRQAINGKIIWEYVRNPNRQV